MSVVNETRDNPTAVSPALEREHELQHLRANWFWFLLLGILLVLGGTVAIFFPIISSVAAVHVLAVILLVAGAATIISSFWVGKWSGFLLHILVGLLYLAAGITITERPLVSIVLIVLFLAMSFIVLGAFRAIAALLIRFPQWGWALLNGTLTFLIGVVIYRQLDRLPAAAIWVAGLLVGLELLFNGWTWIMLATELRYLHQAKK